MYYKDAVHLKRELAEQILYKNVRKSTLAHAFTGHGHGHNSYSSLRKDLFRSTNGISVVPSKNGEFAIKFHLDGMVDKNEVCSYLSLKQPEVVLVNSGIIKIQTTKLRRPSWPGCSVSHVDCTGGSIGCFLSDAKGAHYILSNNHVLANSNNAKIKDPILQPGKVDGGRVLKNEIAFLHSFDNLDFTNTNEVDWAIAKMHDPTDARIEVPIIGRILDSNNPQIGMTVFKYGRTTRDTYGQIVSLDADIKVRYGSRVAIFENQVEILSTDSKKKKFSKPGDSGSSIIDRKTHEIVGLLFAGTRDGTTFANNIIKVLNRVRTNLPNFTIA